METTRTYSPIKRAVVRLGLLAILLLFLIPAAYAQNTKGDRPTGKGKAKRESRFKQGSKKKNKAKQPYNRVQGKRPTQANRASNTSKVYRQKGPFVNNRSITNKISKQNYRSRKQVNSQSVSAQQSRRNSSTPRVRARSSSGTTRNVFPQRGRYVNNRSVTSKISKQNFRAQKRVKVQSVSSQQSKRNSSSPRVSAPSATGSTRNVFPQRGRFVNNPSRNPKTSVQLYSNRREISRNKSASHRPDPPKRKRVVPASASRSYISRRSINPFAGFWNKKPKGEKAHIGDISGRPLRTKNFQTQRPAVLINPTAHPYRSKPRVGDRPYSGQIMGGYVSRSRSGRAWRGDIAGRKIRGRNFVSKTTMERRGYAIHPPRKSKNRTGDRPYKGKVPGGGKKSMSGKISTGEKIPGKPPKTGLGMGSYQGNIKGRKGFSPQGEGFAGSIKSRRPIKGGGSVSGSWNNNQRAISGRTPKVIGYDVFPGNIKGRRGFGPQGEEYTGNIKARKPVKGGGSVSGRTWNNDQRAVSGKTPKVVGYDVFQGQIKGGRPLKGGGSISGRSWNNNQQAVTGKQPKVIGYDVFQGRIKGGKPMKGGGSISGSWNNQGQAITGKQPKVVGYDVFQGRTKASKPIKGGGSISGRVWNNKQTPIANRIPPAGAEKAAGFPGKLRIFDLKPSMRNQGEEFTGYTKAKKPVKGGGSVSGKLWNNNEQAITGKQPKTTGYDVYQGNLKPKKEPGKEIAGFKPKYHQFDLQPSMRNQGEEFTGFIKLPRFRREYIKNPNTAEEALKKSRPDKSAYLVDNLQVKMKQQDYKKRPHGAEGSMRGIGPGKNSIKASEFTKAIRQNWNYKHNPSSADEALNQHEPGKAFVKAMNYQGNIKMKKFEFFAKKDLHPDAQFVKTNKNNADDERSVITNFKLWWARVFKKSDTQPDHLKEKYRKPRYDKREDGLWAD